jgi:hypothetical protein
MANLPSQTLEPQSNLISPGWSASRAGTRTGKAHTDSNQLNLLAVNTANRQAEAQSESVFSHEAAKQAV